MNKATAAKLSAANARFLSKVKRQNEPFQAFLKTTAYKQMQASLADAVKEQADTVASALQNLDLSSSLVMNDDMQPLNESNLAHLRMFIRGVLPQLSDLLDEEEIFNTFKAAFEFSVVQQYKRWGMIAKADVNFDLTNDYYIGMLKDQTNYLLNLSSIDDTTTDQLISLIADSKLNGMTIDEVAGEISDRFNDIGDSRAMTIARTETAQAMGNGNLASMTENGVQTKHWVTAGGNPCEICIGNEDQGSIPVDQDFDSGDSCEPAHPNDECYVEADEIDLDSIDIWDGA